MKFFTQSILVSLFTLFITVFASASASASMAEKIHYISDVDDTIKRSHILGSKLRALRSTNSFTGFSTLYKAMLCYKKDRKACLEQGAIHGMTYVSAAPRFLAYLPKRFLEKSNFPKGELITRPSFRTPSEEFKFKAISEVIRKSQATEFILIGDNGEKDISAYQQITNHFLDKKITSFIHQIYASSGNYEDIGVGIEEGQFGYLTASDLGIQLLKRNLISIGDYTKVVDLVLQEISNKKTVSHVIPKWSRCHEFTNSYRRPFVLINPIVLAKVILIDQIAKARCTELSER